MQPFAIYFPQFYATAVNDREWGAGFTDWCLVANANRRDLWSRRAPLRGYYDGSDPAVHEAQMSEMRGAGLGGLALYHYWFFDQHELAAFERTLLEGRSRTQVPWFLIWANESWSRRWVGDPSPILTMPSDPSQEQVEAHCRHLLKCFDHPSYFRWRGKPLFVWYHLAHFDHPGRVIETYRRCLQHLGVDIAVGHFVKNPFDSEYASLADVSYLFEPRLYFGFRRASRGVGAKRVFDILKRVGGDGNAQRLLVLLDKVQQKGKVHRAHDYLFYRAGHERNQFVRSLPGLVQEVVSPGWNNAPRYEGRFTSLESIEPHVVAEQVRLAGANSADIPPLINAWNEWSEGAAIEPCAYLRSNYLQALASGGQVTSDRS